MRNVLCASLFLCRFNVIAISRARSAVLIVKIDIFEHVTLKTVESRHRRIPTLGCIQETNLPRDQLLVSQCPDLYVYL